MKKIIISVFAAFALVGCVKEMPHGQNDSNEVTVERGPLVPMKAIITDSDSQTRVSVDEQTGKLSWSEGDQVAVVLSDGTNYSLDTEKYTIDHETGILEIPNNSAYVIYPVLQEISLSETKLTLKLPSTHNVATPADAFDNALMKGVVNADENRVEFKNLLGFFKVPLTGEGKLKSAVLRTICRTTSDFHPVSKSATLDLSQDATTADGAIKMATNNAAYAWVRYNFSGDVDLSSNPSVYFAVPAGEYENMGIVLVTDKGSNAIYAANAHEVNRSSVKPVSASAINLSAHTPASPVSLVGTTGDSQEDYANCYIVPPTAGSYEFDCKLADGTNLKGGVTAEIKWAEQAGMINDLCYDPETNKVSFKTNGTEGNALVVLTDNTDDWQTNVWTWHIWITDAPKVLNLNSATTSTNQYYVMDRVLGATWAPSSTIAQTSTKTWGNNTAPMNNTISSEDASDACGVYFQYQNRNPLPRVRDIDDKGKEDISTMLNSRCDVMYGTTQYGQYWTRSSSWADAHEDSHGNGQYVHNCILYPNYQYMVNAKADGVGDNGWIKANLENDTEKWTKTQPAPSVLLSTGGFRFWNSNPERGHDEIMKGKTTHDPCPPGYIIETSTELWHYLDQRKTAAGFARAAADDASYEAGFRFYGMYLNLAKAEDQTDMALYFPCCSYRTSCVTAQFTGGYGNAGYIYAVNMSDNRNLTYTVGEYTYHDGFAEHYGALASSGKTIDWPSWVSTKQLPARAYNVRCRRGKF